MSAGVDATLPSRKFNSGIIVALLLRVLMALQKSLLVESLIPLKNSNLALLNIVDTMFRALA